VGIYKKAAKLAGDINDMAYYFIPDPEMGGSKSQGQEEGRAEGSSSSRVEEGTLAEELLEGTLQ